MNRYEIRPSWPRGYSVTHITRFNSPVRPINRYTYGYRFDTVEAAREWVRNREAGRTDQSSYDLEIIYDARKGKKTSEPKAYIGPQI